VQYVKPTERKENTDIGLNTLEQNYNAGKYSEILIDGNKAIATLSGSETTTDGIITVQTETTILPQTDSLVDLGLKNPKVATDIQVKDKTSEKFWTDMFPTIIAFVLFAVVAVFLISRMGGMANNAMTFGKSRARLYDGDKDKILFKDVA